MIDDKCVYDFDLITESWDDNEICDKNSINTKIILVLSNRPSTIREIAYSLKCSSHSIQLSIDRLIRKELVRLKENRIVAGRLENLYELTSNNIRVYNNKDNETIKSRSKITAINFSNLATDIINNIATNDDKPYDVRAMFIKVTEDKIIEFKKDLEELCKKYESMEELDSEEMYGFIHLLGPYFNEGNQLSENDYK